MGKLDDIELRTEEIENALNRPPHFLVRSGTFLIFMTFVVLLVFSVFIKYPETIRCNLSITNRNPLPSIITRENVRVINYDTIISIATQKRGKLFGCIELPSTYVKTIAVMNEIEIATVNNSSQSKLIHAKIRSVFFPPTKDSFIVNVEISDNDASYFDEALKSRGKSIHVDVQLDDKTVFMRVLSGLKGIF